MLASSARTLSGIFLLLAAMPLARAADEPLLAIIIDDLGHRWDEGLRVVDLPGPVDCAVLPFTPHGRELAELAHRQGHEIMLHLPLAADPDQDAVAGEITLYMDKPEMQRIVIEDLDWLPHVAGVNNHQGSLLTRHPGHMDWLMEILSKRELFFVDSRTTPRTVALEIAEEHGVPATRRDVFLDHDDAPQAIADAFELALTRARQTGSAVLIGHPYPATLEYLERRLPMLVDEEIRLATVAQVIGKRQKESQPVDDRGIDRTASDRKFEETLRQ